MLRKIVGYACATAAQTATHKSSMLGSCWRHPARAGDTLVLVKLGGVARHEGVLQVPVGVGRAQANRPDGGRAGWEAHRQALHLEPADGCGAGSGAAARGAAKGSSTAGCLEVRGAGCGAEATPSNNIDQSMASSRVSVQQAGRQAVREQERGEGAVLQCERFACSQISHCSRSALGVTMPRSQRKL